MNGDDIVVDAASRKQHNGYYHFQYKSSKLYFTFQQKDFLPLTIRYTPSKKSYVVEKMLKVYGICVIEVMPSSSSSQSPAT